MVYAVYLHKRNDTGKIFYVGKAKKQCNTYPRSINRYNRSQHWKNIVAKVGFTCELAFSNLTNEEACKWEVLLIKMYKINSKLVNIADGGEGPTGVKQTPERIKNRADKLKALYASGSLDYLKEKTRTTTAQAKWRKVYCVELDRTFDSLKAAAKSMGYKRESGIRGVVSGRITTNLGLTWKYVQESVGY